VKANDDKGGKRKLSEVELSEDSEGEGPSKKVKSRSVIEDSDREDWLQDREERLKKSLDKVEVMEEVQEGSVSEAEVQEETEKDKGKRKVKEARKARRLERSELMREMIMVIWELGSKVDRFAVEQQEADRMRMELVYPVLA
jgi:hypothetical protein